MDGGGLKGCWGWIEEEVEVDNVNPIDFACCLATGQSLCATINVLRFRISSRSLRIWCSSCRLSVSMYSTWFCKFVSHCFLRKRHLNAATEQIHVSETDILKFQTSFLTLTIAFQEHLSTLFVITIINHDGTFSAPSLSPGSKWGVGGGWWVLIRLFDLWHTTPMGHLLLWIGWRQRSCINRQCPICRRLPKYIRLMLVLVWVVMLYMTRGVDATTIVGSGCCGGCAYGIGRDKTNRWTRRSRRMQHWEHGIARMGIEPWDSHSCQNVTLFCRSSRRVISGIFICEEEWWCHCWYVRLFGIWFYA